MYKLTGLVLLQLLQGDKARFFFLEGAWFSRLENRVLFEAGFGFFFFFWGLEEGVEVAFHADKGT